MRNKNKYLLLIAVPLGIIGAVFVYGDTRIALLLLGIYIFVFRPLTDFFRLKQKSIHVAPWKLLFPFFRFRFFKQLYIDP